MKNGEVSEFPADRCPVFKTPENYIKTKLLFNVRKKHPNEKPKGWYDFPEKIFKVLTLYNINDGHMSGFKLFGANGEKITYGKFDTIYADTIDWYTLKEIILSDSERLIGVISRGDGLKKARHYDF